ncbi:hypothetical protein ACWDBW_26835 [Streptomyces sp. NPDC001107]
MEQFASKALGVPEIFDQIMDRAAEDFEALHCCGIKRVDDSNVPCKGQLVGQATNEVEFFRKVESSRVLVGRSEVSEQFQENSALP